MSLLEIDNLAVHFRSSEGTVEAVRGVSLNVNAGETVAVPPSVPAVVAAEVASAVVVVAATAVGPATSAPAYGPNGVPDTDADGWVSATVPTASAPRIAPRPQVV